MPRAKRPAADLTHGDLVKRAAKWLHQKHAVVITEMSVWPETADAIGFAHHSHSTLIECKISRSDFLADSKKSFRREASYGMGSYRYYMAPPGLIKADELPPGWGLLEVHEKQIRVVREAARQESNKRHEMGLLVSALRRFGPLKPTGVSVKFYTYQTKNTATVGIAESEGNQPCPLTPDLPGLE